MENKIDIQGRFLFDALWSVFVKEKNHDVSPNTHNGDESFWKALAEKYSDSFLLWKIGAQQFAKSVKFE